jgi:DNA-binding transcriptional LysR family regulator
LNNAGEAYQQVIAAAIAAISRGTREVQRADGAKRILLWCVPGFASRWLAANLDDFTRRNQEVEIELRPIDRAPDFASQEADADIRWVRDIAVYSPPAGVTVLRFARPLVFPMASPAWIAANPQPRGPDDLLALRLLHEENDDEWRGWFEAIGVRAGPRLAGPRLWHAHLTLDAARRGQGVCLANPFLLADDVAEGRLAPVLPLKDASVEMGSYVFLARSQASQGVMCTLSDWIVQRATQFLLENQLR